MSTFLPWILAAGPALMLALGLVPAAAANRSPGTMARLSLAAALVTLLTAVGGAVALALNGPAKTGLLGVGGFGLSVYYDALTAVMFGLVAFIGAVVVRYSRNYLDGDAQQGRFFKWLCLTLAAVLLLVLSGNLAQFAAAWIATSLCLHQLLVFYRERPGARLAAAKKSIASRLGDACLLGALVLVWQAFGSLDFQTIFAEADRMRAEGLQPAGTHGIAVLLVLAALLKSAQFPFHNWLPDVMETPTPVSALLHAGIINAGGFLVVRLSDVIILSAPAMDMLAVVGGFTALFGSLVMLTQTSVKVSLAWSTVAQMGFMLLQCGLGAFAAATLHIVAHSLYKAHAFLSSGSVVDTLKASWAPGGSAAPRPGRLAAGLAGAVALAWVAGTALGASPTEQPGVFALGAILLMGVARLVTGPLDDRPTGPVLARAAAMGLVVAVAYFGLQAGAEAVLRDALPTGPLPFGAFDLAIVALVVVSFAAAALLQDLAPHRAGDPRWQALYVHLHNGLYVNAVAGRIAARLRPATMDASSQGAKA